MCMNIWIHVSLCTICAWYPTLQVWKKASDPLELELMVVHAGCGCWESNLGFLEEHPMLLTAKPALS